MNANAEANSLVAIRKRYVLGLGLLLLVVLCWVGGDELTQIIFEDFKFEKPFFIVYFKSAMFSLYLLKLVSYLPDAISFACYKRNPDELIGPSSFQRLEYEDEDDDSDMQSLCSDVDHTQSLIESFRGAPCNGGGGVIKSALKKTSSIRSLEGSISSSGDHYKQITVLPPCEELVQSFSSANDHEVPDDLESSTASQRNVKFRPVAEVRCLASHDLTLQREARRSYAGRHLTYKLTFGKTVQISLVFSMMWFIGNYLQVLALQHTLLSYVELLSATSAVFTLFISATFPTGHVDKLTASKVLGVGVHLTGVTILCVKSDNSGTTMQWYGPLFAISSAFVYSCYIVYFKKAAGGKNGEDDRVDIVLFFGLVGLFSAIFLLPLFPLLHYTNIEPFSLPSRREWKYLIINALIGTVLSDLLWLWSTLLTSALISTVGLALMFPISIVVDILANKHSFSANFFIGTSLICIAFVGLNVLSTIPEYDPVKAGVLRCYKGVKERLCTDSGVSEEIQNLLNEHPSINAD